MQNAKITVSKSIKKLAIFGLVFGVSLIPLLEVKAQSYNPYGGNVLLVSVAITASPSTICAGQSARLTWSSTDATSISVNQGIGSVNPYGERDVSPSQTTTYTITGSNSTGGSATASATVSVSNTCSNSGTNDVTVSITADDTNIDDGDSTTIRWTSSNANSCNASGGSNGWSGSRNTSGSFNTGDLTSDKTYSISCSNSNDSESDSVTVNVEDNDNDNNDDEPEVTTKSATDIEDTSAILRGEVDGNGSSTRVWFEYGTDRDDLDEETDEDSMGSGVSNFDIEISGLEEDEVYYFRAVAENDEGTDFGSILSFRTDNDDNDDDNNNDDEPDVTTRSATSIESTSAILRGEVDSNGSSTDAWFEYGTSRNNLDRDTNDESVGSGSNKSFDTRVSGLRRDTIYYFRAVAENDEGTDRGSILSFRTDDNNDDSDSSLTAITTSANFITNTSAQLNSLILNSEDDDANTWFEWGASTTLNNKTRESDIGSQSSVRHASTITGLVPGVTYYFRAIAEDSSRTTVGTILSFVTTRDTTNVVTPPTTIVRNTTIVNGGTGRNSLVMLTIEGGSEFITNNERREYHVSWENISGQTLRDVVVRVILPESMNFEAANKGSFSNTENTLSFDIDVLTGGESGELSLVANTGSGLVEGELVVVVANLVYTDRSGVQGDALAYMTHTAYTGGSVLGAFAFGAGFLPGGIFGWLLLIILILILVLLGKRLMDNSMNRNHVVPLPPNNPNYPNYPTH